MASLKSLFGASAVLRTAKRGRAFRLPDERTRLPLELMHKQKLNGDFMGDLRVSARDSASDRGTRGR
ncbi:MAG: hypothetical protein JJU29_09500 [Verrucomicrobia bacterium]|nr:hypothetical protein [Verrucomicrobiota bacterium]MCH8510872.1 hypothetical protein [Kiritimatiellia bacterium]